MRRRGFEPLQALSHCVSYERIHRDNIHSFALLLANEFTETIFIPSLDLSAIRLTGLRHLRLCKETKVSLTINLPLED